MLAPNSMVYSLVFTDRFNLSPTAKDARAQKHFIENLFSIAAGK